MKINATDSLITGCCVVNLGVSMKIDFISLPVVGHLNPMTALARRLQSRGHELVFIGVADVEPFANAAGLKFVSFC